MRLKKKEKLTAYWDKKENCIGAYRPLGFMTQTDAHYLFDKVFTKDFVKQMTDRGYDVTTMQFEISPSCRTMSDSAACQRSITERRSSV